MDPIKCARNGDTTFFKDVATLEDLLKTDEDGNSVLSVAAVANHLACAQEIYKRCPSLLYCQSTDYNYTVLHHAAWRGNPEFIKFLITAAAQTPFQDIENGGDEKKLLRMLDGNGQSALHKAVLNDKYEAANLLISADPDFGYGFNDTGGETILMAALRLSYGKTAEESGVRIRRLLLEKQPNLSKIVSGTNKWTALHHATHQGDVLAVKDILEFCPECSELVDSEGRNFLHLAAKFGYVTVVKYVLESRNIAQGILNTQDIYGNTPLHIAALGEHENMALCAVCLRYDPRVNKLTVNNNGQKVLDAVKAQARIHDVREGVNEKVLKDQSDFDLVVCALIATVSFTAGITVPGGYISDGVNHGMATLSKKTTFQIFVISNTSALTLSLYAVFSHYCTRYLRKKKDIDFQVTVAAVCTMGAIFSMMGAFISGSFAVLDITSWLAIYVCVNCSTFFFFAFWAVWRMLRR